MRANSGAFVEIKTIVASSALLLTTFSGAHAADAIVAAEPEPMEYVRVCDAYGDGYFYIPGTETCLSIGGYIRSEGRFGRNRAGTSDWSFWNRAQMTLSTKNDTEYGTLAGVITLRGNIENSNSATTFLQEAYIDIANLRVGMQYSWWDNDRSMSGETDVVSSNQTVHNSIRYMFADTKTFSLGIAVDELEETYRTKPGEGPNNVGIAGQVFVDGGVLSGYLLGSYDTDTEEGAVRAIAYADFDSSQIGIYGLWASGANYYFEEAEWSLGAQYLIKVTDKFSITPGVQYLSNIDLDANGDFTGGDTWRAGVTLDYKIVTNLATKISVQYIDPDNAQEQVQGFVRLQRNF